MDTFIKVNQGSEIIHINKTILTTKPKRMLYKRNRLFFDEFVDYTHNSLGYRTYENIPKNYGLAVGCSHTYGQGLKVEERWSTLVEESSGVDIINLGTCGTGINFILLNLLRLITSNVESPKFIIMQCPSEQRLTLPKLDSTTNVVPQHSRFASLYKDDSIECHSRECYDLIHKLCKKEKIKIIDFYFWNSSIEKSKQVEVLDFARDMDHPGIKTQHLVKEYVMSKL